MNYIKYTLVIDPTTKDLNELNERMAMRVHYSKVTHSDDLTEWTLETDSPHAGSVDFVLIEFRNVLLTYQYNVDNTGDGRYCDIYDWVAKKWGPSYGQDETYNQQGYPDFSWMDEGRWGFYDNDTQWGLVFVDKWLFDDVVAQWGPSDKEQD